MSGRYGRASQRGTGWSSSSSFAANSVISQGENWGTGGGPQQQASQQQQQQGSAGFLSSPQSQRNDDMARLYANDVADAPQEAQKQQQAVAPQDDAASLSTSALSYTSASYESECSAERQNILVAGISFVLLALMVFQVNQPEA